MDSMERIVEKHSPISVLKLNIERMEYAVLAMVRHPIADQLAVSFHHCGPENRWRGPWTEAFVRALSRWYEPYKIMGQWGWWLFLAKDYHG